METCQFVDLTPGNAATNSVPIVVDKRFSHHDHSLSQSDCGQIGDRSKATSLHLEKTADCREFCSPQSPPARLAM